MKKKEYDWKPCIKAWHTRGMGLWILSFFILVGITLFPVVCAASAGEPVPLGFLIGYFMVGIIQLLIFSFACVIDRRKYQMNEEGITICYCGRIWRFYPWTMFHKIVVCDVDHAPKYPEICTVVIRLSALEEPYGPHSKKQKCNISGIATWRKYNYLLRHCSTILLLEYTPDMLDEVVCLSKLPFTFSLTKYGKAKLESNALSGKNTNK